VQSIGSFVLACCAAASLAACAAHTAARGSAASAPGAAARVVTLVPSFADDAYAIGAGAQLVAVSAFTDAPQVKGLPRVADASSVDDEAIVALRPTLVLGIPAQERLTEPLRRAGIRVVLLADDSYVSIFENLRRIGALTGHSREAKATIARLRHETAMLHARTASYRRRPSVFIVLGSGPIWTAGSASYISTLIALAGGTNAANDLHAAYGVYSAEALVRRQPDVLVADAAIHISGALDREPWRSLNAVRQGRLYDVDPKIIERPGPSYNEGVRWLVDRLTPLAIATP
jgi:iron complex transport system substrate-binding protein